MDKELETCPNPNGELGICYSFDKYGDRCGCIGCPLLDTLPNGLMNEGDPLPGLTKQLVELTKERETQDIIDYYQTDLIKDENNEGYFNEKFKTFVHYGLNGKAMDCCPISYKYIMELEAAIKRIKDIVEISRENIKEREDFYKGNIVNKGDFASELHLLMACDIFMIDIAHVIKENLKCK